MVREGMAMADEVERSPEQKVMDGHAYRRDLENGGKVEVWWPDDRKEDGFFLKFTNKDGVETRIGLSGQAMQATVECYAMALRYQAGEEHSAWSFKVSIEEVKADEPK